MKNISISRLRYLREEKKLTIDEISSEFKCGRNTIRRRLKDNGMEEIDPRDIHKKILGAHNKILNLYKNGCSTRQIKEKIGMGSCSSIGKVINKYNMMRSNSDCHKIYKVNDNYLNNIGYNQAKFLGLMITDGSVDRNRLTISLSGEEGEKIVKWCKKILDYDGPLYYTYPKNRQKLPFGKFGKAKEKHTLSIYSKKLCEKLREYNVVENKTYIVKFPEKLIEMKSKDIFYEFLCGCIYGDGWVSISNTYLTIGLCSVRKDFLTRINELCDIKGKIRFTDNDGVGIYTLKWSGKRSLLIGEKIFKKEKYLKSFYKYKIFDDYYKEFVSKNYIFNKYYLTDPYNNKYETLSLHSFCKSHKLSSCSDLSKLCRGLKKQYIGWKGYRKQFKLTGRKLLKICAKEIQNTTTRSDILNIMDRGHYEVEK